MLETLRLQVLSASTPNSSSCAFMGEGLLNFILSPVLLLYELVLCVSGLRSCAPSWNALDYLCAVFVHFVWLCPLFDAWNLKPSVCNLSVCSRERNLPFFLFILVFFFNILALLLLRASWSEWMIFTRKPKLHLWRKRLPVSFQHHAAYSSVVVCSCLLLAVPHLVKICGSYRARNNMQTREILQSNIWPFGNFGSVMIAMSPSLAFTV